jgi:hypothetical protein
VGFSGIINIIIFLGSYFMDTVKGITPGDPIPNGCTKPFYILCDDGFHYAVKFKENPETSRVLINEYVCGSIAESLDLPMAEAKLIEIDDSFVKDYGKEIALHTGEAISAGLHFGTKKIKKTFQIFNSKMLESAVNIECVPEIILFDQLICNRDRDSNGGNLLYDATDHKITLIDHTHAFDLGPLWNTTELRRRINIPFSSMDMTGYVYKKLVVYVRGNNPFSTILDKIEGLTDEELWHTIDKIPAEWNASEEEKSVLMEYIQDRRNRIKEVLPIIKPNLPYWKGGL